MSSPKSLIFFMDLNRQTPLIEGRLIAYDNVKCKVDQQYIATSGCQNNQRWDSQDDSGRGPIPRNDQVKIDYYTVNTTPIYLPQRGIEGNFYKIDPHLVNIWGKTRGDFGIHYDANAPGSAGCVVIRNKMAWEAFQEMMGHYRAAGLESVPLIVEYQR
ncbi:MAG: hypothetical protein QNJ42_19085 [Crocosphaera sp.]|nr:hypothetical protein [Crocosphaera sp.]